MSAVVKPADARRLYQQVADQIRAVIEEGRYVPGARLPPERELALQLGVSRPSLREALIALEIEGRVEIRMGSGVYVCARPLGEDAAMGLLGDSPTELMQARSTLEGAVAALAAARMSKPVLERLRSCVEGMRQDIAKGTPLWRRTGAFTSCWQRPRATPYWRAWWANSSMGATAPSRRV